MLIKKIIFVFFVTIGLVLLPALLLFSHEPQTYKQKAATNSIPQFSHVFVIIEENHDYSQIIGSAAAPYITQLSNQYGLATNFFAITHPSLPNYIAFTSGSTQGITTDCTTCFVNVNNIASELDTAGKTWKGYMESMSSNCQLSDANNYVQRHNPFAYYTNLRPSCQKNDVPYSQFASDLASGTVGNFNFISPDLQNDMHDGTIQQGDNWLKTEIPKILNSAAYKQNGLLIITFDEGQKGTGTTNQIPTIIISPLAKQNFKSYVKYTLYSLLKTISDGLGVQLLGSAATEQDMTDFFGGTIPTGTSPGPTINISPTKNPTVNPTNPQPTSASQGPTQTPTQCATTIPQGHTTIGAAVFLHGLGKAGDNANPNGTGNMNPLHPQRGATLTILNSNNQPVGSGQSCISYNTNDGFFNGTIDVGNLASGSYLVKVKVPFYLQQQITGIMQITSGQSNIFPALPHLVTGDINNDNQLDILDYNILISCFGAKQQTCGYTIASDLDDDGNVGGTDYNLFLRELSVQKGSQ